MGFWVLGPVLIKWLWLLSCLPSQCMIMFEASALLFNILQALNLTNKTAGYATLHITDKNEGPCVDSCEYRSFQLVTLVHNGRRENSITLVFHLHIN